MTVEISVVLCAAGEGKYLTEQLEALARQDLASPWELVFVDNGCTEACLAQVERARQQLPSTRVVAALDRPGPSYGRNVGVAAAHAPLVAFCDDDDVVSEQWLRSLRDGLSDADLVGGALELSTLNTPETLAWRDPLQQDELPTVHGYLPYAMSCNMAVRRATFTAAGGFDETLYPGEDVDLSWRVQQAGGRAGFAAGAVVHYRYRPDLRSFLRQRTAYGRVSARLVVKHRSRPLQRLSASREVWQVVRILLGGRNLLRGSTRRNRWLGIVCYWWGEKSTLVASAVRGRPADVRLAR